MRRGGRRHSGHMAALVVAACLCAGCSGNPRSSPAWLGSDPNVRTRSESAESSALRLDVRPLESSGAVRTRWLVIATVRDAGGTPKAGRRVEWMLEGAGHILEVDERGGAGGRGHKTDGRYAVSVTGEAEQALDGEARVRAGQTWCVVTSAAEGVSHLTVHAPDVRDRAAAQAYARRQWTDAEATLPTAAAVPVGAPAVLATKVRRSSDRQALAGFGVRYKMLDGPGAGSEVVALTDAGGEATARLTQPTPTAGRSRVAVEVTKPDGGEVVARGETAVTWQAARLELEQSLPAGVALGAELPVSLTAVNAGEVESQPLTLRQTLPEGVEAVRTEPEATREGRELVWLLSGLPAGARQTVKAVLKPTKPGALELRGVVADGGASADRTAAVAVHAPQLAVSLEGPTRAMIGTAFTAYAVVANTGTRPAVGAVLQLAFDAGLTHESGVNPAELPLEPLLAGQERRVPLRLTANADGRLNFRARLAAELPRDGGPAGEARASRVVEASRPALRLNIDGPAGGPVGRELAWKLTVNNAGPEPLDGVTVTDRVPAEVEPRSASAGGRLTRNREMQWELGTLRPGESRVLELRGVPSQPARRSAHAVEAVSASGVRSAAERNLEFTGVSALSVDVSRADGPLVVGGRTDFNVAVTNTGTVQADRVAVTIDVPTHLKDIDARGPVPAKVEGGRVIFPPLDALQPGQTLTLTVAARAASAGDEPLRVECRASALAAPVSKQFPARVLPELK